MAGEPDPVQVLATQLARPDEPSGQPAVEAAPTIDDAPNPQLDIAKAAMSRVQPAALTLAGICLAVAFAVWREWRRRHGHHRHSHRRYSLHRH